MSPTLHFTDLVTKMSTQLKLSAACHTSARGKCGAAALPTRAPPQALAARALLSLPFDALREQYAQAVRSGMVENSLVTSGQFERTLGTLEQLSYGPFARRV